jgi:hypothetical protein
MMHRLKILAVALSLSLASAAHGASLWEAATFGIGGQGVWVDEGTAPAFRDAEAIARAALGVTPHVNLVGGASYGVDKSYLRGSGGVRLTATDVNDPNFSIGIGISRHYASEPGSGLDEAAGEAAIGWKPFASSNVVLTGLAAVGLDTGRRLFSAGVVWPWKIPSGGAR